MKRPPELDPALVDRLHRQLDDGEAAVPAETRPNAPLPSTAGLVERVKRAARRRLVPVVHRGADVLARRILDRAELRESLEADKAETSARLDELESLRAEVVSALDVLPHLRRVDATLDLVRAEGALDEVHAATVNLELVKAEMRTVVDRIEQLGQAIAPAAGLEGVAARFSELRERVNALDRRLRHVTSSPPPPPADPAPAAQPPPVSPVTPPMVDRFDYVGFEARFRGESASIVDAQRERYLALLTAHPPVLDVGCGRGELLEVLAEAGVAATGIDLNAEMVAEAQGRGLDAHQADARAWLVDQPEHSLGSIITVHVVEHLELNPLIELLELAASRLVPGGVLIAETPNPASLIVLGNSYILDPTHVRPLHPSLLTFLCERAGFRQVRLEFHAPAEAYHLPRVDLPTDAPPWATAADDAFARLNDVLFGPQEYAVVATTPT